MLLASLTRWVRKWLLMVGLVVVLFSLNIAMVASTAVYSAVERLVWGTVASVSDELADRIPKSREKLEAENAKARADADAARVETVKTRAELETAKTEGSRTKAELEVAETRNKKLAQELDIRERHLAGLTADLEASRTQRKQAVETLGNLKSRIVRAIHRNTSTELLQGFPFVGTALVLGAMAYDVNDACQQLRELETIDASLRGRDASAPTTQEICLLSFDEVVAAFTGKDRGYSKCVADRVASGDLQPPSCIGYDPALPDIEDAGSAYQADNLTLPEIE